MPTLARVPARWASLAQAALITTCAASLCGAADRPNLILILADDFGYECVTANGGESYQTPHLDRLAAEGLRFEHCYVQPLCTPTRVQLMTGRYNIRNYVSFGTLLRSETTFGQLLQNAGYATGICGKWQLGRETDAPQHFGFTESLLWQHTRRPPRYANPGLELYGVEQSFPEGSYGPRLIQDFALDFITRHKDEPFFLYYPMLLTHSPYQPTPDSPDWDPAAQGEKVHRDNRHFAEMTTYMDRLVGSLDSRLGDLCLRERTLLVFVGDNGTGREIVSRFQGADYEGGKGGTTRHGDHVPCLACWPGTIPAGRVCGDLISSTDFLPTLCAAAGVPVPDNIDGLSFLPQLQGRPGTPREWLYSWYSPRQGTDRMIQEYAFNHDHKLYRTGEFYDLRTDPRQQHSLSPANLTTDQSAARARLQAALDRFASARPAELDRFPAADDGEPATGTAPRRRQRRSQPQPTCD